MKAESLCPFPTCPGDTFHLCTPLASKPMSRRGGLRAAQPLHAHPPWSCIWPAQPSWWTTACPQQLLHTHRPSPPSLFWSRFDNFFATAQSALPPLPRKAARLWQEPCTSLMPLPTGSWQAQPSLSLSLSSFALEPRLIFAKSLPQERICSRPFKSLAFSLPQ